MIRKLLLPAACVLLLGGCMTGYGYSDRGGYYYGRPSVNVYGGVGYGSGYPYSRHGYGRYAYPYGGYYGSYGYPYYSYGYPYYPYYPHYPRHDRGDGHDRDHDRKPPWRDWAGGGSDDRPPQVTRPEPRVVPRSTRLRDLDRPAARPSAPDRANRVRRLRDETP